MASLPALEAGCGIGVYELQYGAPLWLGRLPWSGSNVAHCCSRSVTCAHCSMLYACRLFCAMLSLSMF